ncbi:MAG: hypothetical protein RL081_1033 [Pseudomonadota bacterium]
MTYTTLTTQIDDGILTLTLNRPEQMNAFTVEMAHELVDVYRSASANDAVRAIVVTGAGKAFCAGMDLSRPGNVFGLNEDLQPTLQDMQERLDDPEVLQGVRDTGGLISLAVYDCTKPVIGAINGAAVGIGATMTLPMDVRLASDKARIGFVFGRIGIVPEACSSWFLPRIVGISQALEWAYCADILTPEEALQGRGTQTGPPHDRRALPRGHRPDAPDDVPQRGAAASTGGAQSGFAGHVLHQRERWQGGRACVSGEASRGIHEPDVHRHAGVLSLVVSQPRLIAIKYIASCAIYTGGWRPN